MPITVNPGFVWPPDVDPVVSPDGRITVIADPSHAGALLRANYADLADQTVRRNLVRNPLAVAGGSPWGFNGGGGEAGSITYPTHAASGKSTARATVTATDANGTGDAGNWFFLLPHINSGASNGDLIPVAPGDRLALSVRAWASKAATLNINVGWRNASNQFISWGAVPAGGDVTVPAGDAGPGVVLKNEGTLVAPAGAAWAYVIVAQTGPEFKRNLAVGDWLQATECLVEKSTAVRAFFDGSTPDTPEWRYDWVGTPNASASTATPVAAKRVTRVRFERSDGSVVRSGDPAWAPGGIAHAYDHEATLGGGTLWRAVPIRFDGSEGTPSEYVGAVIPALTDGWAWLKPVADPDKAMLLKVEPPDLSYDGRVDTTSIAGAPRPAATWDVLEGFTTQLRSLVREKDVEEQLKALLDEGPVLAQFPACAGLPDFYFIRGKLDLEHVHWDGWPWRRYQWDVIQIDRPDTTDSPLRIPGLSYDTVARDWTTYDQLKSTVESYNKLLEP